MPEQLGLPEEGHAEPMDVDPINEDDMFLVSFNHVAREFKGQTSAPALEPIRIAANTEEDFKHQLWLKIKAFLKREVLITENGTLFAWADKSSQKRRTWPGFFV